MGDQPEVAEPPAGLEKIDHSEKITTAMNAISGQKREKSEDSSIDSSSDDEDAKEHKRMKTK
jgi:hypothetical protein